MTSHFFALCMDNHPAQGKPDVKWQRIPDPSVTEPMDGRVKIEDGRVRSEFLRVKGEPALHFLHGENATLVIARVRPVTIHWG